MKAWFVQKGAEARGQLSTLGEKASGSYSRTLAWAENLSNRELGLLGAASLGATVIIVTGAISVAGGGSLGSVLERAIAATTSPIAGADSSALEESGTSGVGLTSLPPPSVGGSPAPVSAPVAPQPIAGPVTSSGTESTPTAKPTKPPTPAPTPKPQAGRIKHVFVINLASPGYEATFGEDSSMPYLAETLRPKGDLLANYSLLDRSALSNYIASISGQPPNPLTKENCPVYKEFPTGTEPDTKGLYTKPGCIYPDKAMTLADQFTLFGGTWHAYAEDMANRFGPANCVRPDPNSPDEPAKGGYATSRNPFVYFRSLLDLGDCATNDVPFTEFKKDIRKEKTTPNYSFIAPNLCNAGVPGQCEEGKPSGPAAADEFLEDQVPRILDLPAYKKAGLLIITFGEVHPSADEPDPTKVGTVLLSPFVSTNVQTGTKLNPYSLLRTTQDLFGFPHLGNAAARGTKSIADPLLGKLGDN